MKSNALPRLVLLAGVVAAATNAISVEIWAVDNLGTNNAQTVGDRIIRFDSANPLGTVVTVGQTGVATTLMSGLDFDNLGNLYAVNNTAGGFYSISTANGAATLIGNAGINIQDLAWNAATGQMAGLVSTSGGDPTIVSINTSNGTATTLGTVTGMTGQLSVGYAIDSAGNRFVHSISNDFMYSLGNGFAATQMSSSIGVDTNFSQGMTIGAGAQWFLGSISNNPVFESAVRLMNNTTGGTTSVLGVWPNDGPGGLPQYETGDLAINPVPEPGTFVAIGLGLAGLALARRRK